MTGQAGDPQREQSFEAWFSQAKERKTFSGFDWDRALREIERLRAEVETLKGLARTATSAAEAEAHNRRVAERNLKDFRGHMDTLARFNREALERK